MSRPTAALIREIVTQDLVSVELVQPDECKSILVYPGAPANREYRNQTLAKCIGVRKAINKEPR